MRRRSIPIAFILISVAALITVLPLILHGCSCGHDFDFHLVSWMEAAAQFKAGNLHPAWAFSPAWNAGEPRFAFYPPLSWSLGAVLGLVLPWATVPIVYTWIALAAAGFGMYSFARSMDASETASVLASIVYLANPYMLFTAYERTAYAELLAAAWIPLLLGAVLRERVTPLRIAISVALLWLTNAPAAVMGCYALAVLAALRLVWTWFGARAQSAPRASSICAGLARNIVGGTVLGLALAAFYVLPAAQERPWVQIAMATIEGMRIEDNFLFHHTADALHDEVLRTASLIAVSLLCATGVIFIAALLRLKARSSVVFLALLALLVGVLLTPVSESIWRVVPEMTFLQFPWRLTALVAAILCVGVALLPGQMKWSLPSLGLAVVITVLALAWPSARVFTQACDDEDTVAARLAVFNRQIGTDPTDEYTTGSADNEATGHFDPPFWLTEDGNGPAPVTGERPGSAPMHLAVTTSHSSVLILHLRAFPAWRVRVNGSLVERRVQRADGFIAVPLHAGRSQIDISYGMTWDRGLGDGISLIALAWLVASSVRRRYVAHPVVP